jgi:guanine deaminase
MDEFMKIAIMEAEKGILSRDGGPFGAVIVKDGVVIAKAHNRVISSLDPTAHAKS